MYNHQTLVVSLNVTQTVNLPLKSDWWIEMLFQDQQMLYLEKSHSPYLTIQKKGNLFH